MLRATIARRSALPSQRDLAGTAAVCRLLGGRGPRYGTMAQYGRLVASAPAGPVADAARLGRALGLIARNASAAALEDITPVVENGASEELKLLAVALRLKANNVLLDTEESKLVVSGAGNPDAVASLRKAVAADLDALASARPDCWLTKLAQAELQLMDGKYDAAITALDKIIAIIEKRVAERPAGGSDNPVEVTPDTLATIVSLQRSRGAQPNPDVLKQLKTALGLGSAADDDVGLIADVLAAGHIGHLLYDFFSVGGDAYNLWTSDYARRLALTIEQVGGAGAAVDAALAEYAPTRALNGSEAEILKALEAKDTPVVSSLQSLVGKSDNASYRAALKAIDEAAASAPLTGSALENLAQQLREQLLFRAKVDKALALEQSHKYPEAIAILDGIIKADKYLHMWKAFLARGRSLRAYGKVDAADADFKRLFALKRMHEGFDIPQFDEFRNKSVF